MDKIFLLEFALLAALISFVVTPLVRKLAFKFAVVSVPKDERRIHSSTMPLMGGLAIYLSFITCLILKFGITGSQKGIIMGATVIAFYGVLDDKFQLKPLHKLGFQILAACVLMYFGIKINLLTNPFGTGEGYIPMKLLSYPLTLLWVVGITNAVNLIDGLDGLAAGISGISALTIFIIAMLNNTGTEAAFLAIALCGAIAGFLPYNFNPASIFMGEAGSALLGFLLAAISMEGAIKSAAAFAISVPILALGVPIYDTLFAIVRRKINGKPISEADKGHMHHRLLDKGLTQKQSVIIMYLISIFLGGVAIIAMQISTRNSYLLLLFVLIFFVLIAWKYDFFKHKE